MRLLLLSILLVVPVVPVVGSCRTTAPAAGGPGGPGGPGGGPGAGDGDAAASPLPENLLAVRIEATSSLAGQTDTVAAWRVFDADRHATSWCEDAAGAGVGQSITLRFDAPTLVQRVIVGLGDGPEVAPATYARVTALTIRTSDGRSFASSDYPDGGLYAHIGKPAVSELTISIAAVEAPKGGAVACLSDVELDGLQGKVYRVVVDVPAAALDALPGALPAIAGALARCDEAALPEFVAFPLAYRRGVEEGTFADLDALMTACRAGAAPRMTIEPVAALGGLAQERAGEIVVDAGDDARWHLAWRDAGWRLVRTGVVVGDDAGSDVGDDG